MKTISLALRNLTRQKKRSFMLAGAVAFGFFVVTLIEGMVTGGINNFAEQFAYIFGGNVIVEKGYINTDGSEEFISGIEYEQKLRERMELFRELTKSRKSLVHTFITTYGVADGIHSSVVHSEVTMGALFE